MSGGQNLRFTTGFVRFESVAFRANFAGRLAVKQSSNLFRIEGGIGDLRLLVRHKK